MLELAVFFGALNVVVVAIAGTTIKECDDKMKLAESLSASKVKDIRKMHDAMQNVLLKHGCSEYKLIADEICDAIESSNQ